MIAISLQSGSNGNCLYVEAGGARLIFDAGISGLAADRRLEALGRDIRKVHAVIISHDHSDHIRCAGVYQRKFGLPIYVSRPTFQAIRERGTLGRVDRVIHFDSGGVLPFGDAVVRTLPTPHDAADGVAFVVDDGKKKLGILTDLGHAFPALAETISMLDAVFLESNYDPQMLRDGPYPLHLQRRISGPHGHLSNSQAADLLRRAASPSIQWACLAHLSEQNNTPQIALETHRQVLSQSFPLRVASRYEASEVFEV